MADAYKDYIIRLRRTEVGETTVRARSADEAMDKGYAKANEVLFEQVGLEVSSVFRVPKDKMYLILQNE